MSPLLVAKGPKVRAKSATREAQAIARSICGIATPRAIVFNETPSVLAVEFPGYEWVGIVTDVRVETPAHFGEDGAIVPDGHFSCEAQVRFVQRPKAKRRRK